MYKNTHLLKQHFLKNHPKSANYRILIIFSVFKALKDEVSFKRVFPQNSEDNFYWCFVITHHHHHHHLNHFVNFTPLMKLVRWMSLTWFKDYTMENEMLSTSFYNSLSISSYGCPNFKVQKYGEIFLFEAIFIFCYFIYLFIHSTLFVFVA